MRDMLVPIFGQFGAVVAQFVLTIVIVLGLIGAVWWFMRRYSGVHFGGIGRGRVPRLAVVDAIPVDRRRRLLLVRRDNVEHLLLIGGPSDVVVEGAIQRVRARSPQQMAQAAAARAAMQPSAAEIPTEPEIASPESAGGERPANQPIPFPIGRGANVPPAGGPVRFQLRPTRQPPAPPTAPATPPSASFEARPPARPAPAPVAASTPPVQAQQYEAETPAAVGLLSEVMTAEAAPLPASQPHAAISTPATFAQAELEAAEQARQSTLDLGDVEAEAIPPGEAELFPADAGEPQEAAPATVPGQDEGAPGDPAVKVSDLEREMARLLDEITTRRSS